MDFYIISAERFNLSREENAQRTLDMTITFLRAGVDFIACRGVYKGTEERSFMVMNAGLPAGLIESLAKAYEQESVLEVRNLRATLVYFDGKTKPEYLGRFEQHTEEYLPESYTKVGSEYYIVK